MSRSPFKQIRGCTDIYFGQMKHSSSLLKWKLIVHGNTSVFRLSLYDPAHKFLELMVNQMVQRLLRCFFVCVCVSSLFSSGWLA